MKQPDPPDDPLAWRDELAWLFAYSHGLPPEPLRLWVTPEGGLRAAPRSAVEGNLCVREALSRCKQQLIEYLTPIPREEWPASFLDRESGEPLKCVRGHSVDLRLRQADPERRLDRRYLCKCYWYLEEKP